MKNIAVILPISIIVYTAAQPQHAEQYTLSRKEVNDRWIWGSTDDLRSKSATTEDNDNENELSTEAVPNTELYEPSQPTVPDFSAPGVRISEAKCQELIRLVQTPLQDETIDGKNPEISEGTTSNYKDLPKHPIIVGGRDSEPREFPHMGAIGWKGKTEKWVFQCGGSLISTKFVLTAGHCTKTTSRDEKVVDIVPKIVRFGVDDLNDTSRTPTDVNIIRIIPHPSYAPPKKYNDIALIELENELKFTLDVHPACLWNNFSQPMEPQATVTGWGVTKEASLTISPQLQAAILDVVQKEECNNLLRCNRNWCGVQDHQICATVLAGGMDACQGDSGGPLQVLMNLFYTTNTLLYRVIGVTSFGIGCGRENSPGVYTNVASFIDWIEDTVWR